MTRSPGVRTTPSILTAQQRLAFLGRRHRNGADRESLSGPQGVHGHVLLLARDTAPDGGDRGDRDPEAEPSRVAVEDALAQRRPPEDAERSVDTPVELESGARHQN